MTLIWFPRPRRELLKLWGWVAAAVIAWLGWMLIALSYFTPSWVPRVVVDLVALPTTPQATEALNSRGSLGDAFGPFNALVSCLAFIVLLRTLNLQQCQLRAQQDQIDSDTRLIRQQQFQEQFFRAIDGYRAQLSAIAVSAQNGLGASEKHGRDGLNQLVQGEFWKELLTSDVIGDCLAFQIAPKGSLITWHERVCAKVAETTEKVMANEKTRLEVVNFIGKAWAATYFRNRYQLDALFRAWYTVYRILDTAPKYHLNDSEVRLYGASFRAQLSWIELVVLLLNQSGIVSGFNFPMACMKSNGYRVFDNLSCDNDVVVGIISRLASERSADANGKELNRCAFGINTDFTEPPVAEGCSKEHLLESRVSN